jgi:hypothetical protein
VNNTGLKKRNGKVVLAGSGRKRYIAGILNVGRGTRHSGSKGRGREILSQIVRTIPGVNDAGTEQKAE